MRCTHKHEAAWLKVSIGQSDTFSLWLLHSFLRRQLLQLRPHYLLNGRQLLHRKCAGNCKPIVVGELFLPGEPHQALNISGLEELPDEQAKQQATVVVVVLVLDVEYLEAALIFAINSVSYPILDHTAPIRTSLSSIRDILFMLTMEHFCRVNHVDLVLLTFLAI